MSPLHEPEIGEVRKLSRLMQDFGVYLGNPSKRNSIATEILRAAEEARAAQAEPKLPTVEVLQFLYREAELRTNKDRPDRLMTVWFRDGSWWETWIEVRGHYGRKPDRSAPLARPESNTDGHAKPWTSERAMESAMRATGRSRAEIVQENSDRLAYERLILSGMLEEFALAIYREEGWLEASWDVLVESALRHARNHADECMPMERVRALLDIPRGSRAKLAAALKRGKPNPMQSRDAAEEPAVAVAVAPAKLRAVPAPPPARTDDLGEGIYP